MKGHHQTKRKYASNRPFYRYGGHIEFLRFEEYYGMPRGALAQGTSIWPCISREKGDHYYIQTRHDDLFSHYNLSPGKLKQKLA